jgi:hypothetical protein
MNENKQAKNEKEFDNWEELPLGGRRYWFDVKGKMGGFARYIKITDVEENTISFVQEIYSNRGSLTSIHEKYPVDNA